MLSQDQAHELNTLFATELQGTTSTKRRAGKWQCKLKETFIGDYLIVPLTSLKMLKSEGYMMNNCCREYSRLCEDQRYAIFSIRSRSGERLATLGLTVDTGHWSFDQCTGQANSEVLEETLNYLDDEGDLQTEYFPTELYYIAHEVVRLMNCTNTWH